MKLSVWQFLGMIVLLVGLYYFYDLWWADQDRNTWIDKLNGNVYNSADEMGQEDEVKAAPSSTWP